MRQKKIDDLGGKQSLLAGEPRVRDYIALLKPRVMSLVVFTGLCGLLLAPGNIHPFLGALAVLCIAVGSGAAGGINMWYEQDIDAIMNRTKHRPIPAGKVSSSGALEFSVCLSIAAVFLMAIAVNFMAAGFLLLAILFYVFIYTVWLKRNTPQNIVIGGAAGSFPPLIGWVAVTGELSLEPLLLFLIIFLWTPPHFWALALYRSDDYAKAGIPMLPVVAGQKNTQLQILIYSFLLVATSLVPYFIGMTSWVYGFGAAIIGARFLMLAITLYKKYTEQKAKRLFGFSILYLFLIFVLLVADKWALS